MDPDQPFSVAGFAAHARGVLADIAARGGVAILAGGTGCTCARSRAACDTDALPSDPVVRAQLEEEFAGRGLAPLVERLSAIAPTRGRDVDLANPRRVVRALEIAELTGGTSHRRRPAAIPARSCGSA